ncbi:MAG: hypothetical protein ABIT20_11850 [Gemmatimonadaceae bacterium]
MARMSARAALLVILLMLGAATVARAQDTTSTANLEVTPEGRISQVVLRDGSTLNGRVVAVTTTTVRFVSSIGETTIARSAIVSVRLVAPTSVHDGQVWPEDPSRTRLFFAPTGRMLRTGETYFADAYVFFPSVQVGVTNQFTIGGGMSLFPFVSLDEQVFYLTPKVGVYTSPGVNVAVGALVAGAKGITDESPAGIGYGVVTLGDENASVTVGSGFAFARGNTSSTAVLMLGGSNRISRSFALVSENYFTTERDASMLLSGGVRFMSEHLAVDLALFGGKGINTPIPYVAFIYKW